MRPLIPVLSVCLIAGCGEPSPQAARQEAVRLRAALEKHRPAYLKSIADANRLSRETLAWLDGPAVSHSRSMALSEARTFADKWARVYFVPRVMHGQLRFDRYGSGQVRAAHRRVLDILRISYFELHDYQRYSQHASETNLHGAPPGRLPPPLEEFRRRLRARPPFSDELSPVISALAAGRAVQESVLRPVGGSARTPASASGTAP